MSLPNRVISAGKPYSDALVTSAVQEFALGTRWKPNNDVRGRTFRYAKAGAVALVAGNVIQGPVTIGANHSNRALGGTALAGQNKVIVVTALGAAVTANQYDGGTMNINDDVGEGIAYPIVSHTLTTTPTFTLGENIKVALAATSDFSLVASAFNGVVQRAATLTAIPVGVAQIVVPAANYFWLQIGGPVSVLTIGTPLIGNMVGCPAAGTAGSIAVNVLVSGAIGRMMDVNATTEHSTIMLQLDY